MEGDQIIAMVARHANHADALLIEGNRGLYDGLDAQGTYSTAELAKFLATPVVLVVDCTMTTRTAAALVLGCQHFDPQVPLKGVILNQVARPRHEEMLRSTIQRYCGLPVLGAIPVSNVKSFRNATWAWSPRRSMPWPSRPSAPPGSWPTVTWTWRASGAWRPRRRPGGPIRPPPHSFGQPGNAGNPGVVRDSAFQFYYPENLEALERQGAKLVDTSALDDPLLLPGLDGLYMGGIAETHAQGLADNVKFRQAVKATALAGLPIYAECGGLMYLGKHIQVREKGSPWWDFSPTTLSWKKRPQGHGYTTLEVVRENPFFPLGARLRGHEFHYSQISPEPAAEAAMAFRSPGAPVWRGSGRASSVITSWPPTPTSTPWDRPNGPRVWCGAPGSTGGKPGPGRRSARPAAPGRELRLSQSR